MSGIGCRRGVEKQWKSSIIAHSVRLSEYCVCGEEDLAEFRAESGEAGWVGDGGFEVQLNLASDSGAVVEAKHAE